MGRARTLTFGTIVVTPRVVTNYTGVKEVLYYSARFDFRSFL